MPRKAYVAVVTSEGFSIGLAEENKPGYWRQSSHGTFPSYEKAGEYAERLNETIFSYSKKLGMLIGASSMFPLDEEEHAERVKGWEGL